MQCIKQRKDFEKTSRPDSITANFRNETLAVNITLQTETH